MTVYYAALLMTKTLDINVGGHVHNIRLSCADGMIGALPIFDTRESAEEFADGRCQVVAIEEVPEVTEYP